LPKRRRWTAPAVALLAAVLVGGCGASSLPGKDGHGAAHGGAAGQDDASAVAMPASRPAKPMTVEQLADGLGCPVELAGKFADYRMTRCKVDGRTIVVCDFVSERSQREWVNASESYGGYYLLGPRWAVSGNELKDVVKFQGKWGGKIEQGMIHG
jgi:hypothetical protein